MTNFLDILLDFVKPILIMNQFYLIKHNSYNVHVYRE